MRLLNDVAIRQNLERDPAEADLWITGFSEPLLHSTYYYFRLGRSYRLSSPDGGYSANRIVDSDPTLYLEPNQYVVVTSLERFKLSNRVLAVFGQISDFILQGIELVHSPFIDPLFTGYLELGLHNRSSARVSIRLGRPIGKIVFFDVSDTTPIRGAEGTISHEKFSARKDLHEDEGVPGYDSPEPYTYDWRLL